MQCCKAIGHQVHRAKKFGRVAGNECGGTAAAAPPSAGGRGGSSRRPGWAQTPRNLGLTLINRVVVNPVYGCDIDDSLA